MSDRPTRAFKIIDAADWPGIERDGGYAGSAVDVADGYIHLSTADQLPGTAARHYAGRDTLLLIEVDLAAVTDDVRWEPSRGGDLFPHIYGRLPRAAMIQRRPLSVSEDGVMSTGEPL